MCRPSTQAPAAPAAAAAAAAAPAAAPAPRCAVTACRTQPDPVPQPGQHCMHLNAKAMDIIIAKVAKDLPAATPARQYEIVRAVEFVINHHVLRTWPAPPHVPLASVCPPGKPERPFVEYVLTEVLGFSTVGDRIDFFEPRVVLRCNVDAPCPEFLDRLARFDPANDTADLAALRQAVDAFNVLSDAYVHLRAASDHYVIMNAQRYLIARRCRKLKRDAAPAAAAPASSAAPAAPATPAAPAVAVKREADCDSAVLPSKKRATQ
jgi:hypothetical protein